MLWEWVDWVTISITIITLVYIYLTWNYNHWKKQNVAFVKPYLVFGNYKDVILSRTTVGELMEDIYKKGEGKPFIGFWRFRSPGLVIRDPDVIKTVLLKEFNSFHDNAIRVDPKYDPLLTKNPFFLEGEKWKTTRSMLTPNFTSAKLKTTYPLMEEVSAELVQYLRDIVSTCGTDGIETKDLASKFTMEMVGTVAFGIKGYSFKDPNAELRAMTQKVLEPGFVKNLEFLIMTMLPALGSFLKLSLMPVKVDKYLRKIVNDVVSHREKNNISRNDYIQNLIHLKNTAMKENKSFTEEDVTGHAVTFITDGYETSSIVLSFAWFELARNPEVQQKLYEEILAVIKQDGALSFENVNAMPYMDQILQEVLRLYPPLMQIERLVTRDVTLTAADGSSCTLRKGGLVIVPARGLQRDPRYYPDPERFNPDRWAPKHRDQLIRYTYMPFGEGPRLCLGMRFAQAQIKLALAVTVQHFDIKKTPKTSKRVVQDPTYFLSCNKGGLWVKFEPRTE